MGPLLICALMVDTLKIHDVILAMYSSRAVQEWM